MAAAAPDFALAPGLVGPADPLDYTDANVIKRYNAATVALPTIFDLKADNLKAFLTELELRSSAHRWQYMFAIPLNQSDPDTTASLLSEYGRLTKDQVRVDVTRYMNGEHRAAQDDYQIYVCLMNSITKEAKDTMTLLKGE